MNARRASNRSRRNKSNFQSCDSREILCEAKAVSLVTKRFVKLVGIFSGKPCVQTDAPDSSLGEILLRSCNEGATNSTAPHCTQCREGKNSTAGIVMLIAWRRKCADHPTHFAIKHRHKCAVALIGTDPLHSHLHLGLCCFVPEVAHELRERRRIVWLGDANRKI